MMADWNAAAALLRNNNLTRTAATPLGTICYSDVCKMRMHPNKIDEKMAFIMRDQKLTALRSDPRCAESYRNFETFPAAAQVFSLSFAYGRIPIDFPRMNQFMRDGQFGNAATECRVPGMSERKNEAHKELLLFAQNVVDTAADLDSLPAVIL